MFNLALAEVERPDPEEYVLQDVSWHLKNEGLSRWVEGPGSVKHMGIPDVSFFKGKKNKNGIANKHR